MKNTFLTDPAFWRVVDFAMKTMFVLGALVWTFDILLAVANGAFDQVVR